MNNKILFVVNSDSFFVSHRMAIALAAQKKGFEVHLATKFSSKQKLFENAGIQIHPIEIDRKSIDIISNINLFFKLLFVFIKIRPQIVHLITQKSIILGGLAARVSGVKSIVISIAGLGYLWSNKKVQTVILKKIAINIYRIIFNHDNIFFIFQNKEDRFQLLRNFDIDIKKTTLTNGSGVDLSHFKRINPLPNKKLVITFASRLLISKGILDFISAAIILNEKYGNLSFWIAGEPDKGNPDSLSLKDIEILKKNSFLKFHGNVRNIKTILKKTSIFCLPSYYGEGMPKVLLEAAASGLPIITSDHPGCREAIIHGRTGFLIKTNNPDSIVAEIDKLVTNTNLIRKFGISSAKLAREKFSIETVISKHLKIYNKLKDF